MSERTDLWAVDSEDILLGYAIQRGESARNALATLNPEWLSDSRCKIFNAWCQLLDADTPTDQILVTHRLRDTGNLDAVGGAAVISGLPFIFNDEAVIAQHLALVRDAYARRRAYNLGKFLITINGSTTEKEIAHVVQNFQHGLEELRDCSEISAIALGDLVPASADDSQELLRTRFVCRGGGLLVVGPTGIGKSSLIMQASACWAIDKPCFGIAPARPLRSLIIQAENDQGDLAEMRDGVMNGLELTLAERRKVGQAIHTFQEDARSGLDFFTRTVEPLLRLHRPDLLWIDPALSYIDGESNSQADVGRFLRNWLNPLLRKYGCAAVVVHHTNKPATGKEKSDWSGGDFAYLGSGSAEWANWARGVIAIRSLGDHGVFELRLGKRGGRVGWRNDAGEPIYSTLIGHAREPGCIYWRNAEESELAGPKGQTQRFTVDHLVEHLAEDRMRTAALQKVVLAETGMSKSTFHNLLREAEKSRILAKPSGTQLWEVQKVQK